MGRDEIEIKLRADSIRGLPARLRSLGASLERRRTFEENTLLDYRDGRIRRSGCLLRVRRSGDETTLTYKGPGRVLRRAKVRAELETRVEDGPALIAILGRLGLRPTFRYQKFRTCYRAGALLITVDETPIGDYLELEGPLRRIESFAERLGHRRAEFVSKTYYELFSQFRRKNLLRSRDMTFGIKHSG